mmetsp:Transcript_38103/g.58961  ORF Transcript_38103/g.58961 Transcript_38103/m.58961 type:complete len:108 (+) Transcript_38103:296-619(+)
MDLDEPIDKLVPRAADPGRSRCPGYAVGGAPAAAAQVRADLVTKQQWAELPGYSPVSHGHSVFRKFTGTQAARNLLRRCSDLKGPTVAWGFGVSLAPPAGTMLHRRA